MALISCGARWPYAFQALKAATDIGPAITFLEPTLTKYQASIQISIYENVITSLLVCTKNGKRPIIFCSEIIVQHHCIVVKMLVCRVTAVDVEG